MRLHSCCLVICVVLYSLVSPISFASTTIKIDGSTGVKPLMTALVEAYQQTNSSEQIIIGNGMKPTQRIQALIDKNIHIAMASHGINAQQIENKGLKIHHIAKVAVVMGVNNSVAIESLRHDHLCDIYNGKITLWEQLSETNLAIAPFIRPFSEVDTEVISKFITCFKETNIDARIPIKKKSGQMAKALAQTPGSIGMTTMVRVAQSESMIKALSLNGIGPSIDNILNQSYPFTRNMFLITDKHMTKSVSAFLNFISSDAGSAIIKQSHAVPAI